MTRSLRQVTALLAVALLALATTACSDLLSLNGPSPVPSSGTVSTVGFAAGGAVDTPAQ